MATDANRNPSLLITVEVRSVYGRDTIYPVDDAAKAFASIAGTTTLTVPVLKQIIGLGYEVRYQLQREYCPKCEQVVSTIDDGSTCAQCFLVL